MKPKYQQEQTWRVQLHQRPRSEASLSDEWETPDELLKLFESLYGLVFGLDVCAKAGICKCTQGIKDALVYDWIIEYMRFLQGYIDVDVFCNPPNSLTQKFIERADNQWKKHNINILMLIPINATVTKNGKKYIWDNDSVEIHPVLPTPKFIHDGVQGESARNRYCVCIWRKRV